MTGQSMLKGEHQLMHRGFVFLLLVISMSGALFAQGGLGSISGTVVDPSGAVVPSARVVLLEIQTQGTRAIASNEAGLFTLPSVVPGRYAVTVSAPGFKEKKLENITVNAFQQISLGQVALEIGEGVASVVTVTAEQQLVKDSAVRYDTIQARQVSDMPLMGRNWTGVLKAIPGAVPTSREAYQGREYGYYGYADFRINGKAAVQTAVNLDGGSIVDHGSDAKTSVAPSLESIEEVSLLANNFQAEYGTRSGVIVNVVTKSGSNQFRGTVWDYLRNEALNANSWERNYLGTKRPMYRYNYFGGNLGGPIVKNKLFFFYNYERFKQNTPGSTTLSRVPTAAERQGDFSLTRLSNGTRPTVYQPGAQLSGSGQVFPNNVIPPSMLNSLGKAVLNIYPDPNYSADPFYNYVFSSQRKAPRYSSVAKVDWNISDKARAYVRYTWDGGTAEDRGTWNSSAPLPFNMIKQPRPDYALSGNLTYTFSPSVVMETVFGWNRDDVKVLPLNPDEVTKTKWGLSKLPVAFDPGTDMLPGITTGFYPDFHFNRLPSYAIADEYQYFNTISWTRGTHMFKFGGQFVRNDKDEFQNTANKGVYDFRVSQSAFDTGFAPSNVLLGALSTFTQVERVSRINTRVNQYLFFAQDTWKVRRDLTLDYGMRFYHLPTEIEEDPSDTLDAVFLPSKWDAAKAPRFYVPDPRSPSRVIDPLYPDDPLPANLSNTLRYSIVPGSGDVMNGVFALGQGGLGKAALNDPSWLLVAPRGGFAWSPGGSTKTVIRGGFGWTYNFLQLSQTVNQFRNGLSQSVNMVQTSLDTLTQASTVRRIDPRAYGARDETAQRMPTVYDYSISVQRELPGMFVVDIGYIGNLQRHQPVSFELNAVPLGEAFKPEYIDPRSVGYNFVGPISSSNPGPALPGSNAVDQNLMRPYRGHGAINIQPNVGNNRYDSLQATLNKRFGGGLTLSAAYTWSRFLTQQESTGLYYYNWKDYTGDIQNQDRRHVVAINYTYELPKFAARLGWNNGFSRQLLNDWRIAHMISIFSGQDYTPTFSIQQANTTTNISVNRIFLGTDDLAPRQPLLGDPNSLDRDVAHQFDIAQLGLPDVYPKADGTGPRNYLLGRGSFSNDLTITKAFKITETKAFELRASAFNAFNQVRRPVINTGIQYKAKGRTLAEGFSVLNTPEATAARTTGSATAIYNAYRGGVGHVNMTNTDPMRVIEIGVKFRF
ncbi:MAG: TonB-dependent receptor [Bryobacterales bacterium]|nr:TonB-dependent receptor [Bryobacterales bacterium]